MRQRWLLNILIGLLIELLLLFGNDWRPIVFAQNWGLDAAMQGQSALQTPRPPGAMPLAIIDVDEETWRDKSWGGGEPVQAPRDQLLALIVYSIEHHARYVVVDVRIEGRDDAEDATFVAGIEHLVPTLRKNNQYLLFVRTLREPLFRGDNVAPEIRESPLDAVVRRNSDRLYSVAPYFHVSRDGVLREWQLWRAGCRPGSSGQRGHWDIVPSVQLAIAWLANTNKALRPADVWTRATRGEACEVELGTKTSDSARTQESRINRRLWAWLSTQPEITHSSTMGWLGEGSPGLENRIYFKYADRPRSNQVQFVQALDVVTGNVHAAALDFGNGIAIVGQSFEAAGDQYATPLGVMTGTLVIANSAASMLDSGLLRQPNDLVRFAFESVLIVLTGFVFARFDSAFGTIIILFPFLLALALIEYVLLGAGYWLDFAAPLLAIYAHRFVKGVEEVIELKKLTRSMTRDHSELEGQ